MLRLFRGTCEAVRAMHDYRAPLASSSSDPDTQKGPSSSENRSAPNINGKQRQSLNEDNEDSEMYPQAEGDADNGYSYSRNDTSASVPLVSKRMIEQEGDAIFDGDEELPDRGMSNGSTDPSKTQLVPYAHRDLKPG